MRPNSPPCSQCGFQNPPGTENCAGCGGRILPDPDPPSSALTAAIPSDTRAPEFVCPKCGHPSDLTTPDCLKCGVIFTKWFEGIEDLSAQETGQLVRLREIQARRERSAQAERQRLEAERQAELEHQREVLKRRMAQAEAQRRVREEARRRAQAEDRQRAAQSQQQEAEDATRRQAEPAERFKKEDPARLQSPQPAPHPAPAQPEDESRQKADAVRPEKTFSMQQILKALRPRGRLSDLLRRYEGRQVALRHGPDHPARPVTLLRALEDHLVLCAEDPSRMIHLPLHRIDHLQERLEDVNGSAEKGDGPPALVIVLLGAG